jgi:hypothetical protein
MPSIRRRAPCAASATTATTPGLTASPRDGQLVLVSETGEGVPDRSRIEVVPYAGGAGHVVARAGEASWNR